MIKKLLAALAFAFTMGMAQSAVLLREDFNDVSKLPGQEWIFENRSIPPNASTGWVQGDGDIFPSHMGAPDAYIGSSFTIEVSGGYIDDRLFTPLFSVEHGAVASFYLRAEAYLDFFDTVAYGFTDGDGTELSDFIAIESTVVPTDGWTRFTLTLDAQGPGAMARFGFIHYGLQDESNVVGLDTLRVEVPEPASLFIVGLGLAGLGLARRRA